MKPADRPPPAVAIAVVATVVAVWAHVRLWLFPHEQLPLSFVLPLLLCVWTRRRWHLVAMVGIFVTVASAKYFWVLPEDVQAQPYALNIYLVTLVNVGIGAAVVLGILRLRDTLDARAEAIQRQNAELEAQAEELTQQNEEIRTQAEELTQQNEEIASQSEELERQNEELIEANQRLSAREEILQAFVHGSRQEGEGAELLQQVCERVASGIGAPAEALAILESFDDKLKVRTQAGDGAAARLPAVWPRPGSFAGLVLEQGRTAYVDDLQCRPDLLQPFGEAPPFRSLLATPITIGGRAVGVMLACGRGPGHWSDDQFRLLEWAAAQCGWILEGLRWQVALQDRAVALEAAGRAKDDFLATLSHELRTPLSPVLVAVEEMKGDARLPAEVRAELEMIQRNVSVQSRLIDDLLDLTRISRGKIDLDQRPVELGQLLRDSAAVVAGDVAGNGQTLHLEINLPEGCRILGDPSRLQQVFWNLLKNSTKFTPRGGSIRLRAELAPGAPASGSGHGNGNGHGNGSAGRALIHVVDTGAGLAREDLDRIFLPFEQVAAARSRGGLAGLGLGLSIARAITEMHEGTIRVRSDGPGCGTTFTVELPLAPLEQGARPGPQAAPAIGESPAAAARAAAWRILLVEDHGDTGAVMARLLRREGHEVEHVVTVADAITRWREGEFHVLISDLGLPDGSGIDLMQRIRADARGEVNGICMSGYGMEINLAQTRAAGFREHLIKPVSKQQLLQALARCLG